MIVSTLRTRETNPRHFVGTTAWALGAALAVWLSSTAQAARLQDLAVLRAQANEYLFTLAQAAYPTLSAEVRTGSLDPRLRLPHCPKPGFFLGAGNQPHGSGTLGIRCREPGQWTLYLTYKISLRGHVLVTKRPLPARQDLSSGEVELKLVTMEQPPGAYFTSLEQIRNVVTARPLDAGQPITLDVLKRSHVIRPNQRVRILAEGSGFQITQEGTAQNAAYMGDPVRVKMPSGRIIQGVADADGQVRIP